MRSTLLWIVLMVLVPLGFADFPCPKRCRCSATAISCIKAGLKTLPSEVPPSVRYIDLSKNPLLKLKTNTFAKFKQLERLILRDCSLKQSFALPESLLALDFSGNRLTVQELGEMFNRSITPKISDIVLEYNNIDLNGKFSIFPKMMRSLKLKGNILRTISKNDFRMMANLQYIDLSKTGLQSIAEGAFDNLKRLRNLRISGNKLSFLPNKLFQHSTYLRDIQINRNRLATVPDLTGLRFLNNLALNNNSLTKAMDLRVSFVTALDLSFNLIESFNFSGINFFILDLSHNRIRIVNESILPTKMKMMAIYLQDNNISSVPVNAFRSFSYIGELFLHRNRIEKIPRGAFSGTSIGKLSLFANELTTVNGILNGMMSGPSLLLLFSNSKIVSIRGSDFKSMPNGSEIFISCTSLEKIPSHLDIKPQIFCSPSSHLAIETATNTLRWDGFQCIKTKKVKYRQKCTACQVGFYGQNYCKACPAGAFYQDEMAAIACKPCPLGQFVPLDKAPGKSALECLTCPAGTNTNSSAAYRACQCLDGYARTHRFGTCTKCTQNGFSCRQDYPEPRKGYWMTWQTMRSAANVSCKSLFARFVQNLNTYNDTYDRAAIKYDCHLPTAHKCRLDGSCLGGLEARCERGYTGTLCAVCEERYMKSFGKCVDCPSPVVAVLQCMALFAAFLFICWLMRKVNDIKLAGQGNGKDKKTFADLILSTIKILMGFYQVLVGIVHALPHIRWPGNLTKAVRIFEYIQFSILHIPALHCIRRKWRMDAIKEFWFAISATAVIPLAIFAYAGTKSLFNYCCSSNSSEFRSRLAMNTKQCLEAIFLFLFATYPFTSSKIFQIQPASCHTICTSEQSGQCMHRLSFLRSDYHVSCTSELGGDLAVTVAGYAALILPLGFPLLLFILLWRLSPKESNIDRKDGPENDWSINGETASRGEFSIVRSSIRLFNGNYKPTRWYWEVTEMIRKLIISIAGAFLLQNIKIGLFGLIILSVLFAAAHAHTWPMKDEFDNWMQLLALLIVSVNLCFGATQNSAVGDEDILEASKDRWGLGIMLVSLNSLLLVLLLGRLIGEIIRKICQSIENRTCCCTFDRGRDGYNVPSERLLIQNGRDILL